MIFLAFSINSGRFKRRVYFDPKGQSLTLTNTDGIALENEHQQYNGYWYHDFDKNGEFVFYYKDSVGNTGSITAKVTDIMDMDVKPAEKSPIRWWPYKFNPDNPDDQSTLTNEPVNYNVTAQVRFNMNVTEAALYYAENGNANKPDTNNPVLADDAALNITMDLVDITFKKNIGEISLLLPLEISIISMKGYEMEWTANEKRMDGDIFSGRISFL